MIDVTGNILQSPKKASSFRDDGDKLTFSCRVRISSLAVLQILAAATNSMQRAQSDVCFRSEDL